jgi:hypothetical protein
MIVMNGDLYFDEKKYISSSRAAKITGYANDYIGQLCRDGKLECRMVGRSWYVSFNSLINHKNANAHGTRSRGSHKKLRSSSPSTPTLTILSSEEFEENSPIPVVPLISYPDFSFKPESVNVISKVRVRNSYSVKKGTSLVVKTFVGMTAFCMALVGFWYGLSSNESSAKIYGSLWKETAIHLEANVFSGAKHLVDESAVAFYRTIRGWLFDSRETILVLTGDSITTLDNVQKDIPAQSGPNRGMVVVPTTEEMDKEKTAETIKQSFSDEVEIAERDKDTGIITPVFKDSRGNEYLYVLVPIDE